MSLYFFPPRRKPHRAKLVLLGLALAVNCALWAALLIGARLAWHAFGLGTH